MNIAILTLVLFFNGTTHVISEPFSMYSIAPLNMEACWRVGSKLMEGVIDTGIRVVSLQCTIKVLRKTD